MQGLENAVEAFEGAIERETYHHNLNPSQGNIIERTNVTAPAINGNLPPASLPHSLDNYEHDRNMMYNPMRNKPDEGMIPIEVLTTNTLPAFFQYNPFLNECDDQL